MRVDKASQTSRPDLTPAAESISLQELTTGQAGEQSPHSTRTGLASGIGSPRRTTPEGSNGSRRSMSPRRALLPEGALDSSSAGAPAGEARAVSPREGIAVASASPKTRPDEIDSPQIATTRIEPPKTLAEWQCRLDEQSRRPIDLKLLAEVLNEVRPSLDTSTSNGASTRNSALVKGITSNQMDNWYSALSVPTDQVRRMERTALYAGLAIPTSSSIFNFVSYLVLPLVSQKLEIAPWPSTAAGIGVVALQPFVTSAVQSLVIGGIDYKRRQSSLELKLDKSTVNSKRTQSEIRAQIDNAIVSTSRSAESAAALLKRHGFGTLNGSVGIKKLSAAVAAQSVTPAVRDEIVHACKRHLDSLHELCEAASQMSALDGAHARQIEATLWQIAPRALRAGSGALAPYLRGSMTPLSLAGATAGIAVSAIVIQHLAAARDELNGLRLEHKLNMLHADVFSEGGREAAQLRRKIVPEDLSEIKCRNLIGSPESVLLERVADRIDLNVQRLSTQLQELQTATPTEPEAMERGMASHEGDIRAKLEAYRADSSKLRTQSLEELQPETEALLLSGIGGSLHFAGAEAYAKLMKPLEFSAQLSQRIGQTLTLGVAGAAGATVGGRVISAALGGTSVTSPATQLLLAIGSMFLGAIAGATQGMVTNIKNRRRDATPDDAMGFWQQTIEGAIAPLIWARSRSDSKQGHDAAGNAVLEFEEQAKLMKDVLELFLTTSTAEDTSTSNPVNTALTSQPDIRPAA